MVAASHRIERLTLLLGDVFFFYLALYITLWVRYAALPSQETLDAHLAPFSILFAVWVVVSYLAGLYDKQTTILKGRLPNLILRVQIVNVLLAATFFFLVPFFAIAPKTNLVIYLVVSFALIVSWRLFLAPRLAAKKKQPALLVASGKEALELFEEVHHNTRYGLSFTEVIDPNNISSDELVRQITAALEQSNAAAVVLDLHHPTVREIAPRFYEMLFAGVQFYELGRLYEEAFDRLPVSLLPYEWLVSNISTSPKPLYDLLKRGVDILGAFVLGVPSLLCYPFIMLALRTEGSGQLFITQERVGENGQPIRLVKFRTMTGVDTGDDVLKSTLEVTRVGAFLRATRLDEIPQLWNILRGDLSFIGPRPELPALADVYAREIPYYHVRHLIKPGLSGWAQINHQAHPHHGTDVVETKNKLSYDLYYVRERSIWLDLHIAFQTVKIVLSRSGA